MIPSSFAHSLKPSVVKAVLDNILTLDDVLSYMEKLVNPKPRASGFGSDEPGSDFLYSLR